MHVCLSIMARCAPDILAHAVKSAAGLFDSVCIVVAPGDDITPRNLASATDKPTRVIEIPWLGFAPTRTETLRAAESDREVDWVLMIDADDELAPGSRLPDIETAERLGCISFTIPVELRGPEGRLRWLRGGHLMRARRGLGWVGAGASDRHELLVVPYSGFVMRHEGLQYRNVLTPGVPRRHRDYAVDVESFKIPRGHHPNEPRAAYYYAQSLRDAGLTDLAIKAFEHRSLITGGSSEMTFWCHLNLAKIAWCGGYSPVHHLENAHRHSPWRAEPLYGLERWYREHDEPALAVIYGEQAAECSYPAQATFHVEVHAYHPNALRAANIRP